MAGLVKPDKRKGRAVTLLVSHRRNVRVSRSMCHWVDSRPEGFVYLYTTSNPFADPLIFTYVIRISICQSDRFDFFSSLFSLQSLQLRRRVNQTEKLLTHN